MKESFVFTLSEHDSFQVDGSRKVNINDPEAFQYTFWNPKTGYGKKHMYVTPSVLLMKLWICFIFLLWFSV